MRATLERVRVISLTGSMPRPLLGSAVQLAPLVLPVPHKVLIQTLVNQEVMPMNLRLPRPPKKTHLAQLEARLLAAVMDHQVKVMILGKSFLLKSYSRK